MSRRAFEEHGVKVMLLKQAHCEPALLRRMHAPFIETLSALKQRVEPHRVLTSPKMNFNAFWDFGEEPPSSKRQCTATGENP